MNQMQATQISRARRIRHIAFEIVELTERYEDSETKCLEMEKAIVTRINAIIRNLSPFAMEDEKIVTCGTYWHPGEENEDK